MNDTQPQIDFAQTREASRSLERLAPVLQDMEKARMALSTYFHDQYGFPLHWDSIPQDVRLALVQQTPRRFIKTRPLGRDKVPYITHGYATKCLNFISDFCWSSEVIGVPEWQSGMLPSKKPGKPPVPWVECMIMVKMRIKLMGNDIERTVASGHRMFVSNGVTKADCLKSAMSKAVTVFARQFGIGVNIIDEEDKAYGKFRKVQKKMLQEMGYEEKSMPLEAEVPKAVDNSGITKTKAN